MSRHPWNTRGEFARHSINADEDFRREALAEAAKAETAAEQKARLELAAEILELDKQAERDRLLPLPCDHCGAGSGEPCKGMKGFHFARAAEFAKRA